MVSVRAPPVLLVFWGPLSRNQTFNWGGGLPQKVYLNSLNEGYPHHLGAPNRICKFEIRGYPQIEFMNLERMGRQLNPYSAGPALVCILMTEQYPSSNTQYNGITRSYSHSTTLLYVHLFCLLIPLILIKSQYYSCI